MRISELLPGGILRVIPELEKQKRRGDEKAIIPLLETLYGFYASQREKTLERLASIKYRAPDNVVSGELLRRMVLSAN